MAAKLEHELVEVSYQNLRRKGEVERFFVSAAAR